jgi:hypothetical protein
MSEIFTVAHGKHDHQEWYIDTEDGFRRYTMHEYYLVSFTTQYGQEWVHSHSFPMTIDGAQKAKQLAERVQEALNEHGLNGLDETLWNVRTMYGTQAYLDEEPAIVARERADGDGCDDYLPMKAAAAGY